MASVTIKRGTEAEVASTAITDGQILFTTDREYNNQIMADVGEDRILIGGNNVFTGTQAEYEEALSLGLIFEGMQVNITDDYNRDLDADVIAYDNTTSGLDSTTVQGAIDELDGRMDSAETQVGNSYKTTDASDTTIASADKIPFYDESATSKKNIALDNFVDTIAPNFGSQISTSQGNALDLLDKDGNLLDSVTIETKATNVSYTDTSSIGATNVQGAVDYLVTNRVPVPNYDYELPRMITDQSGVDCNTLVNFGFYQITNATNTPDGTNAWFTIMTVPMGYSNTNYCHQFAIKLSNSNLWHRYRANGTWSAWATV